MRGCGRGFQHGPIGRQVAAKHRDSAAGRQRPIEGTYDLAVPLGRLLTVLPHRLSVDRQRVAMEQAVLTERSDHGGQSARVVEILHQKAS